MLTCTSIFNFTVSVVSIYMSTRATLTFLMHAMYLFHNLLINLLLIYTCKKLLSSSFIIFDVIINFIPDNMSVW